MGARKQRAGPGAQVRDRLGRVGQFEREHVPGEAVTPGERQATGRGAAQDFEAGARLGAGQPGDGAAFRDAQGCGGVALQHTPPACARRGNRDRVLVGAGQFLARRTHPATTIAAPGSDPLVLIISTAALAPRHSACVHWRAPTAGSPLRNRQPEPSSTMPSRTHTSPSNSAHSPRLFMSSCADTAGAAGGRRKWLLPVSAFASGSPQAGPGWPPSRLMSAQAGSCGAGSPEGDPVGGRRGKARDRAGRQVTGEERMLGVTIGLVAAAPARSELEYHPRWTQ
jgi:hypothetical protein